MRVIVEADGGSRGNPGVAGYGAVVFDDEHRVVLAERKEYIGTATNNVAEYRGLIAGLEAALELGADAVSVRMDSKLVIEQMSGRWQVKHPDMRPLARRAGELRSRIGAVDFEWIPRERNKHADRLANEAMDAGSGITRARSGSTARTNPATEAGSAAGLEAQADEILAADTAGVRQWVRREETPTRLVLVRHGRTANNVSSRFAGRTDQPLDEVGLAQAEAAALRVARFAPVAAIVSSPLQRTRQTARAVSAALDLDDNKIVVDPGLAETDFGAWEALTVDEIAARWPAELAAWQGDHEVRPPEGESFSDVGRRVRAARDRILRTYPAQTVVVVTHVVPIKALVRLALAAPDGMFPRLRLDPAGVSVIDYFADGAAVVRVVNEGGLDLDGVLRAEQLTA